MSLTQTNATILASYLDDSEIFVPKRLGDAYEISSIFSKGSVWLVVGLKVVGVQIWTVQYLRIYLA
jgi:hypothetical protein